MNFELLGRTWHPVIRDARDLGEIAGLDEALWVSTAAPVAMLQADPVFLAILDPDGDGRIRSDHVREAIAWTLGLLRDTSGVGSRSDILDLDSLNLDHPDGPRIAAAARDIAGRTGASGRVALSQIRAVKAEEVARGLQVAGEVAPSAAEGSVRVFLEHVAQATGRSSVSRPAVDAFLADARAWLEWSEKPADDAAIRPLGEATAAAVELVDALAPKLDQYFVLCDAIRLDPALSTHVGIDPTGKDLLDPATAWALLERAPIARPREDGILSGPVNPVWRGRLERLMAEVVRPLVGDAPVDRAAWERVVAALAPHRAWMGAKPASKVADSGVDAVRAHSSDPGLVAATDALLAESEIGARVFADVSAVEKLALFQQNLLRFANGFVAHSDLYTLEERAFYEMGILILDGRRFNLAVKVPDAARHEKFMASSAMFALYVQVGDHAGAWEYEVCVPVTAGTRGNLKEGMYGVFVDWEGRERHALVRKVVSNPISLREAIWAPLGDIVAGIEAMVDKARTSQQAALTASATAKVEAAATSAATLPEAPADAPPKPAPPAAGGQVVALAAGAGLAVAAVGSVLSLLFSTFTDAAGKLSAAMAGLASPLLATAPPWVTSLTSAGLFPVALVLTLLGFLAVPLVAYLIPVVLSAWLKLRRRDLAALLEGGGWAVNARMYLTNSLAVMYTRRPDIPFSQRRVR